MAIYFMYMLLHYNQYKMIPKGSQKALNNYTLNWCQTANNLLANLTEKKSTQTWKKNAADLVAQQGTDITRKPTECQQRQKDQIFSQKKKEWKQEQSLLLLDLFQKYHTKWTKIASFIKNRNQFSVKSHFYAIIKKCLRKLSDYMIQRKHFYKHLTSIPIAAVSKMLTLAGSHYQKKIQIQQNISIQLVQQTKILLLQFLRDNEDWQDEKISKLIDNLLFFSKNCRRRKKKKKAFENKKPIEIEQEKIQRNQHWKIEKKRREELWEKNVKVFPKSSKLPNRKKNDNQLTTQQNNVKSETSYINQSQNISQNSNQQEQNSQKQPTNENIRELNIKIEEIQSQQNQQACSSTYNEYTMMNYFTQLQYLNFLAYQQNQIFNYKI